MRTASFEESKDQVERLKWVYVTLVPAISTTQPVRTQNAALAMIRLVLTENQAKDLLAALQQSQDKQVAQAAEAGVKALDALEAAKVVTLIRQMNAGVADIRRKATGLLESQYRDSDLAIGMVLEASSGERMNDLTSNGLINALYYLSRTDPSAWTQGNLEKAAKFIPQARARNAGPQTSAEISRLESLIASARKAN